MTEPSGFKKFLLELSFCFGVLLAVVLTAVDIIFGIGRYLIGRFQGKPHFNPWANIQLVWKMIGLHIAYLIRLLQPSFREGIRRNREAMHRRAASVREAFRRTGDANVFRDFDYADGFDVAMFFLMVPYTIIWGIVFAQAAVAMVTVISVYGVYKHYQVIAVERTVPQQQTVVKYIPQVADKQETDFGPSWLNRGVVLDKVNDPSFKNVALLSDTGSVKYSEAKVVKPNDFVALSFNERVVNPSITSTGQVHFLDQLGQEFTINKEQAFMFEGYASKMFMFDGNGKLMAIAPEAAKVQ